MEDPEINSSGRYFLIHWSFIYSVRPYAQGYGILRKCIFNIMANMDLDMFKVVPIMIVPSTTLLKTN